MSSQPGNPFGGAVGVAVGFRLLVGLGLTVGFGLLVGLGLTVGFGLLVPLRVGVGVGPHVRRTMFERCLCPSPSSPIT
ncbi:hypothetical protein [Nonomuraea basaltis]|uniref:hypothetical protein n=1 Tax=Nonomuraea basaltis TaxID=2495887 RepID=UPI0014866DC8|nr:hypothetical protein [Nonomuraea basaltis]